MVKKRSESDRSHCDDSQCTVEVTGGLSVDVRMVGCINVKLI